jgi:hypothetical protein
MEKTLVFSLLTSSSQALFYLNRRISLSLTILTLFLTATIRSESIMTLSNLPIVVKVFLMSLSLLTTTLRSIVIVTCQTNKMPTQLSLLSYILSILKAALYSLSWLNRLLIKWVCLYKMSYSMLVSWNITFKCIACSQPIDSQPLLFLGLVSWTV